MKVLNPTVSLTIEVKKKKSFPHLSMQMVVYLPTEQIFHVIQEQPQDLVISILLAV